MKDEKEETQASSFSKGLTLSVLTGLLVACTGGISKYMKNIHPWLLLLYMTWAASSFSLPGVIASGENVLGPPTYRLVMIVRFFFYLTSIMLRYMAIQYLPLGEALVLSCCSPIFVTIAAAIVLKERITVVHVLSLITVITGIVLITKVYEIFLLGGRIYTREDIFGITAALGSVCADTGRFLTTRKMRTANTFVLLFHSGVGSVVVLTISVAYTENFACHYKGLQQVLIILAGIFSFANQMTQVLALKFMEAGPVTTIKSSSLIFTSFLLQNLIFGDITDGIKITGAVLVLSSIVFVGFSKRINSLFSGKCSPAC